MSPKQVKSVTTTDAALVAKARAIEASSVQPPRFNAVVAMLACNAGLDFLEAFRSIIERDHRGIDWEELARLPAYCGELRKAQVRIDQIDAEETASLTSRVGAALEWRVKLLGVASGLAANGFISKPKLAQIEEGMGIDDAVGDLVALVELLTPVRSMVEVTCGKEALGQAMAAAEAGIKAQGERGDRAQTQTRSEAVDLRNRFATLVATGSDRLRVAVSLVSSYSQAAEIMPSIYAKPSRVNEETVVDQTPEPAPS